MFDQWQMDEDERFIQKTEGRCMNCGDWSDYREKVYGIWMCKNCAESEQFND